MKRLSAFFMVCLFVLTHQVQAAEPLILSDKSDYLVGGYYIELYEDSTGILSLSDIQQGKATFKKVRGNFSATHHADTYYWIRFKINNAAQDNQKWILEILDSRQDEVILYQPSASGTYTARASGMSKGFANREYQHKNMIFDLNTQTSGDQYYYLKIHSKVITSMLFKVRTLKDLSNYGFTEYYLLGLYYGILAMMIIFSLFLYLSMRENLYLYYPLYIALWIFISMMKDGTGFQFLWPYSYHVSVIVYYLSKPLLLTTFVIYSFDLLSFENHPKFKKVVIGLSIFYIVYYTLSAVFDFSFMENIFFHAPMALIFYIAILNYQEGYKPARYFILGNAMVLLSLVIEQMRDAGWLDAMLQTDIASILAVYSTNISMVLEIIILSFAMADRVRFLKIEKEKTQQLLIEQLYKTQEVNERVNQELDIKVKERTQQLQEANEKLLEQSEEINKMNALLDKDNWNLKKNLIEQKESRIALKNASYEDFLQVYPDEASALKYMENLKWEKGYACIKCGNTKYGAGKNIFSRRCTKCRHDETVTANTLFNKCKFPINKALYIVTIINRDGDAVSITDLSQQLDLRYATCWAFAKKVLESRTNPKYLSTPNDDKLTFLILHA